MADEPRPRLQNVSMTPAELQKLEDDGVEINTLCSKHRKISVKVIKKPE